MSKAACQVSVGSLPVYVTSIPPRIKGEDSFAFSLGNGAAEQDIEKAISYSSSTLPRYSVGESDLSPTSTNYSEFTSNPNLGDVEAAHTRPCLQSVEASGVPTHSRPFMPPSILPLGSGDARLSQSLDGGISVAIQTEYGIAL